MSGEADHGSRLNESGAARRIHPCRPRRHPGCRGRPDSTAMRPCGSITSDKPASQSQTRFIKLSSVSVKSVT